jgi:flavin reductase (DIM6/NTAB) family NADH-FMN oxidoreductase RutF
MSLPSLGIPDLEAVPFGNQSRTHATHQLDARLQPFAIQGTVAHLNCSIYKQLDNLIDDDHLLILGKVAAAQVNPSYWDLTRNLFHLQKK